MLVPTKEKEKVPVKGMNSSDYIFCTDVDFTLFLLLLYLWSRSAQGEAVSGCCSFGKMLFMEGLLKLINEAIISKWAADVVAGDGCQRRSINP